MSSRRDQVQAQSYVHSRLVSALVAADPEIADHPHRPMLAGTAAGLLLAAVIVVGFGVYGFVRPGGATNWQQPAALIVEKETGSRYVYVDGRLRPVLNYASARLLIGDRVTVVRVSAKSLATVAHGQPVGIAGAPDSLPSAAKAATQVWTVCAPAGVSRAGNALSATTVSIGPVPGGRPLGPDEGFVVSAADRQFLLWRGHRLRLDAPWMARVLGAENVTPVRSNWLQTVPAGPDLRAPVAVGRGRPGPTVDGRPRRIGELFVLPVPEGPERYFVLNVGGLARLTPMQYALAAADPATAALYPGSAVRPAEVSLAELARLSDDAPAPVAGELPEQLPRLLSGPPDGAAWCLRRPMSGRPPELVIGVSPAPTETAALDPTITTTDRTADAVAVAPGAGGLYLAGRFDQGPGTGLFLITDTGVKHPVATADAARRLGYPAPPGPCPPELLDLLPTGPVLGP